MKTSIQNSETIEREQSNNLTFKTSKVCGKETIYVSIRLNDKCKNGHQDFAITGDIYQTGKPKTDRYHISGGCIHDDIAKHFPEFIPFIRLHLADYSGVPMSAVENGFYHLTQGFNNTKPDSPKFAAKFCEYYRVTDKQFRKLQTAQNKLQYALMLQNLGILNQWKIEADAAILQLEELTGKTFVVDSVKTQYSAPTAQEIIDEEIKQASGYYTPKAQREREEAKRLARFAQLEEERTKELNKINLEYDTKKQVLEIGGAAALDNCIFYNHTNTLAFNWRGYDQLPTETVDAIISKLVLPEGVTVETKSK